MENEEESEETQLIEPVEVYNTMLKRLLIKKVHLSEGMDIGRGGAMGTLDNKIYVNTNSNNDDRHKLQIYNMEDHFQYEIDDLHVPTNYQQLLASTIAEVDRFVAFRYRVMGLYVEGNDDDTHTLYASHMYYVEEENCISSDISRTTIGFEGRTASQLSDWEKVFTTGPFFCPVENVPHNYRNPFGAQMHGGKLLSYDDETLLVSIGGFSSDPRLYTDLNMDPESPVGKFILVDKNTGDWTPYVLGVRNSQGLLIDKDGTIWSTEHGPQGGDELNILEEGKNLGFPEESYGIQYGGDPWEAAVGQQGRHEIYDKPVYAWMRSIAPNNLIQVGDRFPLWSGDLLVSSLGGQSLRRLRFTDENNVHRIIYDEPIDIGNRMRDIVKLPEGRIVILTDDGHLYILDNGGPAYEEMGEEVQQRIANLDLFDRLLEGEYRRGVDEITLSAESIYTMHCASCHNLQEVNDVGPHLSNLIGRNVGELDNYNYSSVLTDSDEVWTPELLRSFLLNPDENFPNSMMPQVSLSVAEVDSVIFYLESN